MNSTPPATTASHWPAAIRPTAGEKEGGGKEKTKIKQRGGSLIKLNKNEICTSPFFFCVAALIYVPCSNDKKAHLILVSCCDPLSLFPFQCQETSIFF